MDANDSLILHTVNGDIQLEPSCLIVFVDETGHEEHADESFPVFGLGGCAIKVADYYRVIREPWFKLKEEHFGNVSIPLHANELKNPTINQLNALNQFFADGAFYRLALLTHKRTILSNDFVPYKLIGEFLFDNIRQILPLKEVSSVAIVNEKSVRGDELANKYLTRHRVFTITNGVFSCKILIYKFFMPKSIAEPGLEVADFIMHTAGAQSHVYLNHSRRLDRKDFNFIFRPKDKNLARFLLINESSIQKQRVNEQSTLKNAAPK